MQANNPVAIIKANLLVEMKFWGSSVNRSRLILWLNAAKLKAQNPPKAKPNPQAASFPNFF